MNGLGRPPPSIFDDMPLDPWLTYGSFRGNHHMRNGSTRRADVRALAKFLPALKMELATTGMIPDLEDLLQASKIARSSVRGHQMMIQAVKALVDASSQGSSVEFATLLRDELDRRWYQESSGDVFTARAASWPQTNLFFRCLAEISIMFRSKHIGNVLGSFWQSNSDTILRDSPFEADAWMAAIVLSCMTKSQKALCLRPFARCRDELSGLFQHDELSFADYKYLFDYFGNQFCRRRPRLNRPRSFNGPYSSALVPRTQLYGAGGLMPPMLDDFEVGFDRDRLVSRTPSPLGISKRLEYRLENHACAIEDNDARIERLEELVNELVAELPY